MQGEVEVLFEYSTSDYRCIISTQQSKLCRNIEYHLRQTGVSEPEVAVLSYTACKKQHDFSYKDGIAIGHATLTLIHLRK